MKSTPKQIPYFSEKYMSEKLRTLAYTFFCAIVLCMAAANAYAEDAEGEESAAEQGTSYVKIDPAFVTNYGGTNRLRYVKVDVTLKVANGDGPAQIAHHMPVIKDKVLTLLSQQSSDDVASAEGKEAMRAESLAQIAEFLAAEDGESHLKEVLFTSFVAHTL